MSWLVTGANGYVGRHVVERLNNASIPLIGIDLSTLPLYAHHMEDSKYESVDIRNRIAVEKLLAQNEIKGIVHLAGLKTVAESFNYPSNYYETNVESTDFLLSSCVKYKVGRFILASSAAVYGNSISGVVKEDSKLSPISPYGHSKMMAEKLFQEYPEVDSIALRFFNICGASRLEFTELNGQNLIPIILKSLKNNRKIQIFGNNFPTVDGTAERDYVDVIDVSKVIEKLIQLQRWDTNIKTMNVGSGKSHSVLEVINVIQRITGKKIEFEFHEKREGDVDSVLAEISLVRNYLDFTPTEDLAEILKNIYDNA
jgi:UDP-glucose 4-epimerase